jgi:hypothetical protein
LKGFEILMTSKEVLKSFWNWFQKVFLDPSAMK